MDHKIPFWQAKALDEIFEVERKIRASNCAKKNASLDQFNWYIRSCRAHPDNIIMAYLVAKTRGVGYSARIKDVPHDIIEYWK